MSITHVLGLESGHFQALQGRDILSQLAIIDVHLYYADMETQCVPTETTHPEPSIEFLPPAGGAVGAVVP